MTTLTPSLHMESYSPDDNRFDLRFVHPFYISRLSQFPYVHLGKLGRLRIADKTLSLRPFLYPNFTWAYKKIERSIAALEERGKKVLSAVESKSATGVKKTV